MVHNKDFAIAGKKIDTGEWVAEVFDYIGVELLGDLGAPQPELRVAHIRRPVGASR